MCSIRVRRYAPRIGLLGQGVERLDHFREFTLLAQRRQTAVYCRPCRACVASVAIERLRCVDFVDKVLAQRAGYGLFFRSHRPIRDLT